MARKVNPGCQYARQRTPAGAKEATRLLNRCRTENKGTPWELLADWELQHPLGIAIKQITVPAPQSSPPAKTAAPAQVFRFPSL